MYREFSGVCDYALPRFRLVVLLIELSRYAICPLVSSHVCFRPSMIWFVAVRVRLNHAFRPRARVVARGWEYW